jgi:hypothetical protein
MLTLFLEFLSYITHNLREYVNTSNDDAIYRKVLYVYTLLDRITFNFEKFSEILVYWQQHVCEGGAWSGAQGRIGTIDHTLHLLGEDLNDLIGVYRSDEEGIKRCKFRGGPVLSKFDVFDIWAQIIRRNAVDRFSGWISDHSGKQVKRTIYIPNYSLLLPTIQRTSQLGDVSQSQWIQVDFEFLDKIAPDLNRQALSFLPELPPEFPINSQEFNRLAKPAYAKMIEVPSRDQELILLIEIAQHSIAGFRSVVQELRDELVTQGMNAPEKLLKAF